MDVVIIKNRLNHIEKIIQKHAFVISLIFFMIILFVFKSGFKKYQYIAGWISTVSLVGVFMQLQWRHQDMYRKHLKEKRDHQVLWTVKRHTGIFSGIINNSKNWPLIYVKNFSGKYVYNIDMKFEIFNVMKITQKGKISVNPNGKSYKYRKGNTIVVKVAGPWSYICSFRLNNTYVDSESTTPEISNEFLFQLFNQYFKPGKYTFTLLFFCLRNSHKEMLHVTYKYCNNIYKCRVLNLDKVKNK